MTSTMLMAGTRGSGRNHTSGPGPEPGDLDTSYSGAPVSSRGKRIKWSHAEQETFVQHCAEYQLNHFELASTLSMLRHAMRQMPDGRRREINTVVPYEYLQERIYAKVKELKAARDEILPIDWDSLVPAEEIAPSASPEVPREQSVADQLGAALRAFVKEVLANPEAATPASVEQRVERIESDVADIKRTLAFLVEELGVRVPPATNASSPLPVHSAVSPTAVPTVLKVPDIIKLLEKLHDKLGTSDLHFEGNAILGFKAQDTNVAGQDLLPKFVQAYMKFLSKNGLGKHFAVDVSSSGREYYLRVTGHFAYGLLETEAGVHRYEAQATRGSKLVTGTISVSVLPEIPETEFKLKDADLRVERCKSSGPGGQNVNKRETAIKLIHTPSGESVEISSERSQNVNLILARKILTAKLAEKEAAEKRERRDTHRRGQIGRSHPAEAQRTLDFLKNQVRDQRTTTKMTTADFLKGNLDQLLTDIIVRRLSLVGG